MSSRTSAALALAAGLCAACGGEVGTIEVSLVTSPGSDLLDRIERVRAVLSPPGTVIEAERDEDGQLAIDFEVTAENATAVITLEGFDGEGERIALGRSAPLPVAAINAEFALFLAPPLSLTEAPVALDPARSEIGAALLPYGAILVGGRDAGGEPVGDVTVYNVYDHALQIGLPLPQQRASATAVSGTSDRVYIFGGLGPEGAASSAGWAFSTGVSPAGAYTLLTTEGDLARSGAAGVFVAGERFLITGAPAVEVDGLTGLVSAWPDAPPMVDGVAARLGEREGEETSILVVGGGVGETGAVSFRDEVYRELDAPAEVRRSGHGVVALADGRALVVGGAIEPGEPARSGVLYDPQGGEFTLLEEFLAAGRLEAAIAASSEYVLVAGGADSGGVVSGDAEVFDAASLEPVATLPLVAPRRGARALVLANGQILIAGGANQDGTPVGILELFTPRDP